MKDTEYKAEGKYMIIASKILNDSEIYIKNNPWERLPGNWCTDDEYNEFYPNTPRNSSLTYFCSKVQDIFPEPTKRPYCFILSYPCEISKNMIKDLKCNNNVRPLKKNIKIYLKMALLITSIL